MTTATNNHVSVPENESSFPSVPAASVSTTAQKLFDWLGSFWSAVYEDPDFVKYVQGARALRVAQLYLDILEAMALVDRANAPVFHRERWFPIVVRRSRRNMASSTFLKVGGNNDAVLGEQTNEVYPKGTVFKLGGKDVSFSDLVVFELDPSVRQIATCIVDNIAEPKTILHSGTDFSVVDGSLVLRSKFDPFSSESAFPVFDLSDESGDAESVLWACDAMIDRNYVYGHLGYALGLPTASTENYKRIVNAVWNTLSDGASPRALQALIAAICDVPTIKNEKETVETIIRLDDDGLQVITDKEVYTLPKYSQLRPSIHAGTVLERFDLIDDSIRVYPYVTDVDRLSGYTEFADKFESDVPAIDLPPALFRTSLEDGFSVGWDERPITCHGFDANGNPKLGFRMDGSDEDNEAFWKDVWATYESTGASIEFCFKDVIADSDYAVGKVCGMIRPIKFFLRQLVGANTLVVTVRTDVVGDGAPLYDPKFFQTVRECVPSYVRLFFIEHESVGYGFSDSSDSSDAVQLGDSDDETDDYAYEEAFDDVRLGAKNGFRAKDRVVSAKWVARCRDKDLYDELD